MSGRGDNAQYDRNHSVDQVIKFKKDYNTMLSRINHSDLNRTAYTERTLNIDISEAELDPKEKLKLDIGNHLNKLIGKTGAKHDDKRAILINDQASPSDLETAKETHKMYNRTSTNSDTQKLVDRVLDIMPTTALVRRF